MPETYIRQEEFLEKIKTVQIDGVKVQVFKFNSEDNDWFRFPTKTLGKIKAYIAIKYPDAVKHNVHKGVPSFHSPAPKFASGQIPTVEEDMLTPEELTEEQAEDLRPPKVPPQAPPDRQPDENSPKELFPPPGPPQSDQVSSDRGTGMVG